MLYTLNSLSLVTFSELVFLVSQIVTINVLHTMNKTKILHYRTNSQNFR